MKKKGFATTGILYTLLLLFVGLLFGVLQNLQNKKTILDNLKMDTVNALACDCDTILSKLDSIENKVGSGGGTADEEVSMELLAFTEEISVPYSIIQTPTSGQANVYRWYLSIPDISKSYLIWTGGGQHQSLSFYNGEKQKCYSLSIKTGYPLGEEIPAYNDIIGQYSYVIGTAVAPTFAKVITVSFEK